jgi:hypothetical protein
MLPGRKSDFRADVGPDCYLESTDFGGQQLGQNLARKPDFRDFRPGSTIA